MFIPNNFGMLSYKIGNNKYGEPMFSTPVKTPCAIIELKDNIKKTAVRADSSASRANADELVATGTILFPAKTPISAGSKFNIVGIALRCIMVEPRYSTGGHLDHLECDFEVWSD